MKKYFVILLLLAPLFLFGQDTTLAVDGKIFVNFTLGGAVYNTADVTFSSTERQQHNNYFVTVTSTATDSATVFTLNENRVTWTVCGVTRVDLNTTTALVSATTTAVKYKLVDPLPIKIRVAKASAGDTSHIYVTVSESFVPTYFK